MFFEPYHPDVPQADWQAFSAQHSPYAIQQVIDRSYTKLPDDFFPLARGVVVPSDELLRKAGHAPGKYRPRGWEHWSSKRRDHFGRSVARCRLFVREFGGLWTVERRRPIFQPLGVANEALAYRFGSTPVVALSYQAAIRLCEYSHNSGPPSAMAWLPVWPADTADAVEFAKMRRAAETLSVMPS